MNTDEGLIAKSDQHLSTADLAGPTEQTRDPHEEDLRSREQGTVLHHEGGLLAEAVSAGIFEEHEAQRLRSRWTEIQGDFVDDPRRAVKEADALVTDAMKRLAEIFANERKELEQQWDRGDNVTTEDLRLALHRYHAFFDRLLSV